MRSSLFRGSAVGSHTGSQAKTEGLERAVTNRFRFGHEVSSAPSHKSLWTLSGGGFTSAEILFNSNHLRLGAPEVLDDVAGLTRRRRPNVLV